MMIVASSFLSALVLSLLLAGTFPSARAPDAAARSRTEDLVRETVLQSVADDEQVALESIQLRLHKSCQVRSATLAQPLKTSGRIGVRLAGQRRVGRGQRRPCAGFAWVKVRLQRQVVVTMRALARGENFAGAVTSVRREIKRASRPLRSLAVGAVATRPLPAGTVLTSSMVRAHGAAVGSAVPVEFVSGGIRITVSGTALRCGKNKACARLKNGQVVRGQPRAGTIIVAQGAAP